MASSSQMDVIFEQALRWHAATTRDDCDWQAFTDWLAASPLHRQAFDEAALLEGRIAQHRGALASDPALATDSGLRPAVRGLSRPMWLGAVAASVLAVVVVAWTLQRPASVSQQLYVAEAGINRSISLADGVQVTLASGSSLQVAGLKDQSIKLTGSAYFDVPHDPKRTLTISAGGYQVRDIGTRFEVTSAVVGEGQVSVALPATAQPLTVHAGQRLLIAGNPAIAEYGDAAADEVAGWRMGRLEFRNEPLSMVVAQLGRYAGVSVTVDPSIAQRRFSGVLVGDASRQLAQLVGIMGLAQQQEGADVHLVAVDVGAAGR